MEKEISNKEVSLSKKVYERLTDAASFVFKDFDFKYETILFGNEDTTGKIEFEEPSPFNTAVDKDQIIKEIVRELLNTNYNSFALIKVSESDKDTEESKKIIRGIYSSVLIRDKNFLTGVLKADSKSDDISLELYDNKNDRFIPIDKNNKKKKKGKAKVKVDNKKTN